MNGECSSCSHRSVEGSPTESPEVGRCINLKLLGWPERGARLELDEAAPFDAEHYSAGLYTGPRFGCIHWEGKT